MAITSPPTRVSWCGDASPRLLTCSADRTAALLTAGRPEVSRPGFTAAAIPVESPYCSCKHGLQLPARLTAATIPVENPHCSCKLTAKQL